MGILEFNEEKNQFILSNEFVYQFTNTWKNQKKLMNELEKMSFVIAQYIKENNIDELLYMSKFQEVQALSFFSNNFENFMINLESMSSKFIDVYDFFYDTKYYPVLSYKHKVSEIIKTFMKKYGDEYENYDIVRDVMKFFRGHLRKRKNINLKFELIKKHNLIDIYKGYELMNYINLLANWNDSDCINSEELKKKMT
ncbi:hypothetical protein [Spiroplasma taiwanense]|uniref:Uncharacterized protein n=1 Tax=Spiroplasma taiwanense CT-1 TaxID=1276220 RepID=S5LXL0_9MOLU|nr:hypothetical protein [Spiroplasma taiwanense]AGR41351.1 hypothetical protein STAIW_v1c07420 [Spiroplasma taiwanense CT-1]